MLSSSLRVKKHMRGGKRTVLCVASSRARKPVLPGPQETAPPPEEDTFQILLIFFKSC